MKIATYVRVNSETQAKDGTIQSQIEVLREYAQANNLDIVQEFVDDGFSGAELNRPGFDQLREFVHEGLIEGILLLSSDRAVVEGVIPVIKTDALIPSNL